MPTIPLPENPDLGHLRRQAKDFRRAMIAGDPDALAVSAHHLPGRTSTVPFPLTVAQLVVARRYGFRSWPKLKQHVELVNRLTRAPESTPPLGDPAEEFLRLACLTYGGDSMERRTRAAGLLSVHPEIRAASIWAAAATAETSVVRTLLAADPTAASREGGPYGWVPLMYLAYARHDPGIDQSAVLATARALLAAGADPNAGYLWHGLPSAFTVLTGVFGEGEQGVRDQPRHPCSHALARLLLESGADANDSQALYNRMFEPGNDHLELLLAFGLGRGDGGPWRRRLGTATGSPAELVDDQLWWAVEHDLAERVQLLLAHGADPESRRHGRSLLDVAARAGNRTSAEHLIAAGAAASPLEPVDALLGALAAGDRSAAAGLLAVAPQLLEAAKAARPSLLIDAVAANRPGAVRLILEHGFDVNAYGRSDAMRDGEWETALHAAAGAGRIDLVHHLLAHGADPTLRDRRFDATPQGWARHFDQLATVELLERLTPE